MKTTLGGRIYLARKRLRLTQTALGEMVGAERNAVGEWEGDKVVPDGRTLIQLPKALQVSCTWLLYGEEPGAPSPPPLEAVGRVQEWFDELLRDLRAGRPGGGGASDT